MEPIDTIEYNGYRIQLFTDEDAGNPFTEFDGQPTLVLQEQAERHFGWSTDKEWVPRLQAALEQIREHGVVHNLYGPGGALGIVCRWLKVAHRMPVVLPVSVYEHSGTMVYLGNGNHWSDPGGWDSGWIGWLLVTAEQAEEWGQENPVKLAESAKACFDEFAAWVSGDVLGYVILDPDGVELDLDESCWGFYGSDCFTEPDGYALKDCKDIIDGDIATRKEPA